MFEITRRKAEVVIVDGFIGPTRAVKVTVLEVEDGRVQLGIEVLRQRPIEDENFSSDTFIGISSIDAVQSRKLA